MPLVSAISLIGHFFQIDEMKRTGGNPVAFILLFPSLPPFLFLPPPSLSLSLARVKMDRPTSPVLDYSHGIPRLYTSKALSFEIPFYRYWQPISAMTRTLSLYLLPPFPLLSPCIPVPSRNWQQIGSNSPRALYFLDCRIQSSRSHCITIKYWEESEYRDEIAKLRCAWQKRHIFGRWEFFA